MYKTTQDQGDYLKRVASHATKPSRRGIIRDIPVWAKEPEDYYNTVLEQHDAVTTRLYETRERVIWLRRQLKTTLPFEEYDRKKRELELATALLITLEEQAGTLRAMARAASNNAWGAVFYFLAQQMLDRKLFRELDEAAQEILNRKHQELSRPHTEFSAEKKTFLNRKDHLRKKRNKVRVALETRNYRQPVTGIRSWHAR